MARPRTLVPETAVDVSQGSRAEAELDDVDAERAGDPAPRAEPRASGSDALGADGRSRRAMIEPHAVDAPLEKHAAVVFEGAVRSASGTFAKRVALVVLDGRLAGTTDPSGSSYVEADAAPPLLQVWVGDRCVLQHPLSTWRFPVLDYHSERTDTRWTLAPRRD